MSFISSPIRNYIHTMKRQKNRMFPAFQIRAPQRGVNKGKQGKVPVLISPGP